MVKNKNFGSVSLPQKLIDHVKANAEKNFTSVPKMISLALSFWEKHHPDKKVKNNV